MILDILLRWVWVAVAFCLSAFIALVTLFVLGTLWTGEALREAAARAGDPLVWHGAEAFGAVFFTAAVLPALTAAPGVVAVLVGEIFRIRSGLYYTLAGGAALAAIPLLAAPGADVPRAPEAEYMTLFAVAGFAAGAFYWLIAGRRA